MYESLDSVVLADLKDLSNWIEDVDATAKVNRIRNALQAASNACREARLQSNDDLTRHQLARLDEGLVAAARIAARFHEERRTA
jgi:hypothetical protein